MGGLREEVEEEALDHIVSEQTKRQALRNVREDERAAIATARGRSDCQESSDLAGGKAKAGRVDGLRLFGREGSAVEHLRIRSKVASHVGSHAIRAVRVAAVAWRGARVHRPIERRVEITIQERSELEQLRAMRCDIVTPGRLTHTHPHSAQLCKRAIRLRVARIPMALVGLVKELNLEIVPFVSAWEDAVPGVVRPILERCVAALRG